MPRYFFDITDPCGYHRDEFGVDCADFTEAREQAQGLLPDLAREQMPADELHVIRCDVRDERDIVVYRGKITFEGWRAPMS